MKYYHYLLCRASGDIETCKCPKIISPYDFKRHVPHAEVFLFVPKGHSIYTDQDYLGSRTFHGEGWVYINTDDEVFALPEPPKTDRHAYRLITDYARYRKEAA